MSEELHEECGVFGIRADGEDVARLTHAAILWLQHRGQESAGIATSDGQEIRLQKQDGRVDHFTEDQMVMLAGKNPLAMMAIGHNRYSNTGGNIYENFQPFVVQTSLTPLALAHNGNLVNPDAIAKKLKDLGVTPQGSSDSELIALLIAVESQNASSIEKAIELTLKQLVGAYSLVIMTKDQLIGVRDPWGIRPLSLGRLNDHHYLLASETCAIEAVGGSLFRDLEPGEMVVIDKDGEPRFSQILPKQCKKLCIFEFIYFASPGSIMYNRLLQTARRHMGEMLWKEFPLKIDNPDEWVVGGVPNTGLPAAQGFAEASGLEFRNIIVKNPYVFRTFIQPDQRLRKLGVKAKLLPLPREVMKKKVILVEDSIVRGNTSGEIIEMLRKAGAKEVHMMISSPPYLHRCYMGVDTQYSSELIAAQKSIEEIRQFIKADSLSYLSMPGLIAAINKEKYAEPIPPELFCDACFTGKYPFPIPQEEGRFELSA